MSNLNCSVLLAFICAMLGVVVTTVAKAGSSGSSSVQYFATLPFRETPFSPLRGIHPISVTEAETRKHFRFSYDNDGRPVGVSFMQGGDIVDLTDSANYYFFAPKLEITYGIDTETRTFFDKHGNRITVSGNVFKEVYRLDGNGYHQSLEFYDVDGKLVENSWGVARYEWSLLDDGTVTEKRYGYDGVLAELRGGFPFYEVRFHYGPNGWLSLMQNFGHQGQLTLNALNAAQDRLEFTATGDLLSWTVLDEKGALSTGNGPGVARGILERDTNGYEIVERYENEKGEAITNAYGFSFTRKVNDRFGNRIEGANYTLDGAKLMVSKRRGYAGYRATFDDRGRNRIMIEFFDEERKPVAREGRGYYRIRTEFDGSDNEIVTRYEGFRGNLLNRQDAGFAKVERDFDNLGRLIEVRYFDENGMLINHAVEGYALERIKYGEYGVPISRSRYTAADARKE